MFWRFDLDTLPENFSLDSGVYDNGDVCHTNIVNLTEKQERAIAKRVVVGEVQVCTPDGPRVAALSEILEQKNRGLPR